LSTTHHPYDLRPSEDAAVPEGWPTENGLLGCLTCHDIIIQCVNEPRERWRNADFPRRNPKAPNTEFCLNCHSQKRFGADSPHDQLDEQGLIRPGVCLHCHVREPETRGPNVAATKALKAPVVQICTNCHGNFPHPVGVPHLLPADDAMLQRMLACEIQEQYVVPMGELQRYMKNVRRLPRSMPIDPKTRMVTCNTCHNPHERGVLAPESPLARGAETDAVRNYRLRMPADEICQCCHRI
jgi:hypothetical protein